KSLSELLQLLVSLVLRNSAPKYASRYDSDNAHCDSVALIGAHRNLLFPLGVVTSSVDDDPGTFMPQRVDNLTRRHEQEPADHGTPNHRRIEQPFHPRTMARPDTRRTGRILKAALGNCHRSKNGHFA